MNVSMSEGEQKLSLGLPTLEDMGFTIEQDPFAKGGFGQLYRGCSPDGEAVAIKAVAKQPQGTSHAEAVQRLSTIANEVDILARLTGSLNVIHLYSACENAHTVYVVMELCRGGEIWHTVGQRFYTQNQVKNIMLDVIRTLAQCHSRNIVHRDIKPGNFLFQRDDKDSPLKCIDFGLAEHCQKDQIRDDLGVQCTPWFMPPECLQSKVTQKGDVWAAGIMAFQLLTGYLPFDDHKHRRRPSMIKIWQSIKNDDVPKLPSELEMEAQDFVSKCLTKEFQQRPTAEELLQHPWLSKKLERDKPISGTIVQRLQRFALRDPFKRKALATIANEISQAVEHANTENCTDFDQQLRLAELKSLFSRIDMSNNEKISADELANGLYRCGYQIDESETKQLLRDSEMDFGEWAAALLDWEKIKGSNNWDEWARKAFELLRGNSVSGKEFGRARNSTADWEGSFGKFCKALQEETGHNLNLYPSRAGNIDAGGGTVSGTRKGAVRAIDILEGRAGTNAPSNNEAESSARVRGESSALKALQSNG